MHFNSEGHSLNDLKVQVLYQNFRDNFSRKQSVHNILNLEGFDILFLQETHCLHIKEAKF